MEKTMIKARRDPLTNIIEIAELKPDGGWHRRCIQPGDAVRDDELPEVRAMVTQHHTAAAKAAFAEATKPPPPKPLTRDGAKRDLVAFLDEVTAKITGPVPVDEKLAWSKKERAATAYLAGNATADLRAMIEGEAAAAGEDATALANKILAKAARYNMIVALIAGVRRKAEAAIDAGTPEQFPAIIDAAKAAVQQRLA